MSIYCSLIYHFNSKKMKIKPQYLPVNLTFKISDKITVQTLITDKNQILKLIKFHVGNTLQVFPKKIRYTVRTDQDIYSGYIIEFEGVFVVRAFKKILRKKN